MTEASLHRFILAGKENKHKKRVDHCRDCNPSYKKEGTIDNFRVSFSLRNQVERFFLATDLLTF